MLVLLIMFAAVPVQRQCSTLSDVTMLVLDMMYSNSSAAVPSSPTDAASGSVKEEEGSFAPGEHAQVSRLQQIQVLVGKESLSEIKFSSTIFSFQQPRFRNLQQSDASVCSLPGEDLCGRVSERLSNFSSQSVESGAESSVPQRAELECLKGSAQAARARLAEEQKVPVLGQIEGTDSKRVGSEPTSQSGSV